MKRNSRRGPHTKHAVEKDVVICKLHRGSGGQELKKYQIIYADPPWCYTDKGKRSVRHKYPLMEDQEVLALPVKYMADEDSALFLWATYPKLKAALKTIEAWGFTYVTQAFTWAKLNSRQDTPFMGMGYWTRSNAEVCLLATRGKRLERRSHSVHSLILAPRRLHSQKPDEARERIVELLGDIPRIELFARSAAPGWDCWGNEAPGSIDIDPYYPCFRIGLPNAQEKRSAAVFVNRICQQAAKLLLGKPAQEP